MAKKKRLRKLVEKVSEILGDEKKVKKIKKAKALERFIGKLEDRHRELKKELDGLSGKDKATREKARKVGSLGKQIKKAKKILADMK